jgi:signal transduction histidine kinase
MFLLSCSWALPKPAKGFAPLMKHPTLRTVFVATSMTLLLLPLVGIASLRLFENELIRRTESELYAQGAFATVMYREALEDELMRQLNHTPSRDEWLAYGREVSPEHRAAVLPEDGLRPIPARLDRSTDEVLPSAPELLAAGAVTQVTMDAGGRLERMLADAQSITLSGIRIADFQGTEVASTWGADATDLRAWQEIRRALRGETVATMRERLSDEAAPSLTSKSRRTRVRVFVAMPVMVDDIVVGAVVLTRTPVSLARALYEARIALSLVFGLLVVLGLIIAWFLQHKVGRPIRALMEQTAQVTAGRVKGIEIGDPGTREVQHLARSVDEMAAALRRRGDAMRLLATAVSHEFKTPLASLGGAAELLADHPDMAPDERAGLVEIVERETKRMRVLVQQLLELARADAAERTTEATDVSEVVATVAREFAELIVTAPDAAQACAAHSCYAAIPPGHLASALRALLCNAYEHGAAPVALQCATTSNTVQVLVRDAGPGVSDGNLERVFEPFFTTARASGGTGVGLAVARRLVSAQGGTLVYERDADQTVFRLTLPRASTHPASA